MFQKIRDLCQKISHSPQQQHSMQVRDNLATKIFGQVSEDNFVLSNHLPRDRYGVRLDDDLNYIYELQYKNSHLPGFENLGPNEKYVVHKIFHSPSNIVCIVGGIGVGKTSFSKYLIDKLIPQTFHCNQKDSHHCPGSIYFNFNAYDNVTFSKENVATAERNFVKLLSSLVNDALIRGKFFTISEQIGRVWNEILREPAYMKSNNTAISNLRIKLDLEELGEERFDQEPDETIGKRKHIYRDIVNSEHSLNYFAALLNYVKHKYYAIDTPCLFLIIDNVDREPPEIQRVIEKIIRSFAEQCDVKVIFNIRQTTYHQGTIDKFSALVDKIPYCGPVPLEVIYSRIDNFVDKGAIYERCRKDYQQEGLDALADKLKFIKENFLTNDRFTVFFQSLSGHSVRKGLMIAQNIILNSVYNPLDTNKPGEFKVLRMGDILRALIVGTNETFSYTSAGVIENVYQTQSEKNVSHFIKLRILKAVRKTGRDGLKIKKLVAALKKFGYSEELIIDSLDEMLLHTKRLIWTDTSSTTDESSEYLIKNDQDALIFINTIGEGYINFLFNNVDYIQEVMMDTSVESSHFGVGWNHQFIEDRLALLLRFCEYLFKQEQLEIKNYFKDNSSGDYERIFGDRNLISLEIVEQLSHDIEAILDFVFNHSKGEFHDSIEVFKESQIGAYYLLIREAKIFQKQWFGH